MRKRSRRGSVALSLIWNARQADMCKALGISPSLLTASCKSEFAVAVTSGRISCAKPNISNIPKSDRRIRHLEIEGVDTGTLWYPPAGVERRITSLDLFGVSTFDPSQSPDKTVAITILKERPSSGTFTLEADFNVERVTTVLQEIAADHKEEDHAEEK